MRLKRHFLSPPAPSPSALLLALPPCVCRYPLPLHSSSILSCLSLRATTLSSALIYISTFYFHSLLKLAAGEDKSIKRRQVWAVCVSFVVTARKDTRQFLVLTHTQKHSVLSEFWQFGLENTKRLEAVLVFRMLSHQSVPFQSSLIFGRISLILSYLFMCYLFICLCIFLFINWLYRLTQVRMSTS